MTSTIIDIAPANNFFTKTSTVTTYSDLVVEISGNKATVPKDSNVTFAVKVTNQGWSNANAPNISIPLLPQMTFVSVIKPVGWSAATPAAGSGGSVVFSAASLATGATAEFKVVAKVKTNTTTGKVTTTTATAAAATSDQHPFNNSGSATFVIGTVEATVVQPVTTGIKVNSKNGLFDVTVHVTNSTPLPINGFRLHVDYKAYKAAYPSLRLEDATSTPGSSDVYIDYPYPMAVNAKVSLKLSFYTRTRTFPSPFKPVLKIEMFKAAPPAGPTGTGVQARLVSPPQKSVRVEFPTVTGRWYRVSYSADLVRWSDSPVPVQAAGTRMQWIDSGPPFTDVSPANAPSRFYRVNEIPTP